jgi:hypothetical protein
MNPQLKLTRISGNCRAGDCPAAYLSNRNTVVVQGPVVHAAEGLRLGEDERAVELPMETLKEAVRALGW